MQAHSLGCCLDSGAQSYLALPSAAAKQLGLLWHVPGWELDPPCKTQSDLQANHVQTQKHAKWSVCCSQHCQQSLSSGCLSHSWTWSAVWSQTLDARTKIVWMWCTQSSLLVMWSNMLTADPHFVGVQLLHSESKKFQCHLNSSFVKCHLTWDALSWFEFKISQAWQSFAMQMCPGGGIVGDCVLFPVVWHVERQLFLCALDEMFFTLLGHLSVTLDLDFHVLWNWRDLSYLLGSVQSATWLECIEALFAGQWLRLHGGCKMPSKTSRNNSHSCYVLSWVERQNVVCGSRMNKKTSMQHECVCTCAHCWV